MDNSKVSAVESQIKEKSLEMLRIHENTLWYAISEKKASMLGDRIEVLSKEIEALENTLN